MMCLILLRALLDGLKGFERRLKSRMKGWNEECMRQGYVDMKQWTDYVVKR